MLIARADGPKGWLGGPWRGDLLAVAFTVLAAVLRWALDPLFADTAQFLVFYFSVMFAAVVGGTRAGLLATVLGAVAGHLLFVHLGDVGPTYTDDLTRLAFFLLFSGVAAVLAGRLREARDQAVARATELAESQRRYRIVADHTDAWEFWLSPEGLFLYNSPSCKTVTGYDAEAFQADPELFARVIHPEDRNLYEEHRGHGHEACVTEEAEFRIVRADGTVRWIGHTCVPLYDEDRRFLGIRGSNRDITERKEAAERQRQSEEQIRLVLDASDMGWWRWDFTTDVLDGDAKVKGLIGLPTDEPIQSFARVLERTCPEHHNLLQQRAAELKARPGDYEAEFCVTWPDGSRHWVLAKGRSFGIAENKPLRAMGIAVDITARKQVEEQLRRVAQFPEENPNPVLRVSNDGRLLYANRAAMERLTEMGGSVNQPVPAPFKSLVERALKAGGPIEYEFKCAEGRVFSFVVTPIADAEYVNLYGRDVTDRRRAEEERRESELRYRTLFDSIDEGFCIIEVLFDDNERPIDYRFLEVNPAFEKQTGLVAVQGKRMRELAPKHEEHWFEAYGEVALTGRPARFQQWADQLQRWFDVYAFCIGQPDQRRVAVLFGDITQRKRAEEELIAAKASAERAKVAAEHANRAKDHFLAVLSHELRTPLTPVVMGVSMLQDRPDFDPQVRDTLEMVRRNVEMEARLIDDLLDVTRIARGKIELSRSAVELCTVIQRAVEVCSPDIEARQLHFGVDRGPDAPYWVEADAARLQQVFWNLLKNAIKFTPHGGCVGIRCRPNGEHVVVEVNDSGIGIEPEALSRVFNAFEQAERSITRQFGGLGLGLAISKALVEMHGGKIEAHSEGRDKGATFRIRLPLAAPVSQPEAPAPTPQRAVRPLRILLVEDHGVTAKMMKMVLSLDGHTVETAGDVSTALEMASQNSFDLLMSDLGLPDGSGHDLMRQLRQRGHRFPAVALSGYGQEEDIRRSYEAGFAAHLTKPASREAVVEIIAAVAPEEPAGAVAATIGSEPTSHIGSPPFDADSSIFDLEVAIRRCFRRKEMLQSMVETLYKEVDRLFPQMRAALQKGDIAQVGHLGHRLKGTVVYLGAQRAHDAALRVEQFAKHPVQPAEAEESVNALERECEALKMALSKCQCTTASQAGTGNGG